MTTRKVFQKWNGKRWIQCGRKADRPAKVGPRAAQPGGIADRPKVV
jgi:hypothetical protein